MINDIISKEHFEYLSENGLIVDGTNGGLVLGLSHDEGGIYMIMECDEGHKIIANMEGGEYLLSSNSYAKYKDRIISINSERPEEYFIDIDVLRKTPILQLNSIQYLLLDRRGQYIVNKDATCHYLEELNQLNSEY